MITDHMELTTYRDAQHWANEILTDADHTDADEERLAAWIWEHKSGPRCSYAEHPISTLDEDAFAAIVYSPE